MSRAPSAALRFVLPRALLQLALGGKLVALGCALLTLGCASSATASEEQTAAQPIRIRYAVYSSGQNLELVNPAHSDRTELYSSTRKLEDAGTKVSTDEVLEETLRYFREQGFDAKAVPGAAPANGGGAYSQALEIETPARHVHMLFHRGLADLDRRIFLECAKAFADVYNNTYQLQSVDRAPDWDTSSMKPAKSKTISAPRGQGDG